MFIPLSFSISEPLESGSWGLYGHTSRKGKRRQPVTSPFKLGSPKISAMQTTWRISLCRTVRPLRTTTGAAFTLPLNTRIQSPVSQLRYNSSHQASHKGALQGFPSFAFAFE